MNARAVTPHYDRRLTHNAVLSLFADVYAPASAFIFFDKETGCMRLKLFDTDFGIGSVLPMCQSGARAVVLSNHPEGDMNPTERDVKNIEMIKARGVDVQAYVVCEKKRQSF